MGLWLCVVRALLHGVSYCPTLQHSGKVAIWERESLRRLKHHEALENRTIPSKGGLHRPGSNMPAVPAAGRPWLAETHFKLRIELQPVFCVHQAAGNRA